MLALGKLLELTLSGHEPAEKTQVTVKGVRLRWLAEGALEVCPAEPAHCGLDLMLSAGIHGHETAPVELLERLLHGIASGTLIPRVRVLFLFGNPAAIRAGKPFIERDANRLFSGRHAQSSGVEALRVAELEQIARGFFSLPGRSRLHYDLHTTVRGSVFERFAVYPFQPGRAHSRRELARLASAGVQAVLLQDKPSATFSAFTYEQLGAEAFTLELGQVHVSAQRQTAIVDAWQAWLACLIEATQPPHDDSLDGVQLFSVAREIVKYSDNFRLHVPADIAHFTELSPGLLLAEDLAGTRWVVEEEGARLLFPDPKARNGSTAGLLVVPDAGQRLG